MLDKPTRAAQWAFDDEVDLYFGRAFRRLMLWMPTPVVGVGLTIYQATMLIEQGEGPDQTRTLFRRLEKLERAHRRRARDLKF